VVDLIIIGSGPSALSAAIYAARDGLEVRVFEKLAFGGIVTNSDSIENYPGFDEGISGLELSKKMKVQAEKFGAKFDYGEVLEFSDKGNFIELNIDGGFLEAKTVLIATGNSYKMLGLPREEEFFGRGIHTCATCDGPFYAGKDLIAVGGGNSAITEALFLSKFSKVNLLVRNQISAQEILQKRLFEAVERGRINLFLKTEIKELLFEKTDFGEKIIGAQVQQKTEEGEKTFNIKSAAIFEFIGLNPNSDFAKKSGVETNNRGEIIVNSSFETNIPRVYASGDILENSQKQIVVAASTGAQAAISIANFIHNN
jgi:FAD-dependent pyridine nucleotide-disulphide oxidoreductase